MKWIPKAYINSGFKTGIFRENKINTMIWRHTCPALIYKNTHPLSHSHSSYIFVYTNWQEGLTGPFHRCRRISSTYAISVSRNDINCKYIWNILPKNKSSRKGLIEERQTKPKRNCGHMSCAIVMWERYVSYKSGIFAYEDFGAKRRYRHGQIITSHVIIWDVIQVWF